MPRRPLAHQDLSCIKRALVAYRWACSAVFRSDGTEWQATTLEINSRLSFVHLYLYFVLHSQLPRSTVSSRIKRVLRDEDHRPQHIPGPTYRPHHHPLLVRDPAILPRGTLEFKAEYQVTYTPSGVDSCLQATLVNREGADSIYPRRMARVDVTGTSLSNARAIITTPWTLHPRGTAIVIHTNPWMSKLKPVSETVCLEYIGDSCDGDRLIEFALPYCLGSHMRANGVYGTKLVLTGSLGSAGKFLNTILATQTESMHPFSHYSLTFSFTHGVPPGHLAEDPFSPAPNSLTLYPLYSTLTLPVRANSGASYSTYNEPNHTGTHADESLSWIEGTVFGPGPTYGLQITPPWAYPTSSSSVGEYAGLRGEALFEGGGNFSPYAGSQEQLFSAMPTQYEDTQADALEKEILQGILTWG